MSEFNITNSSVEQLSDSGNNYKISGNGNNAISEVGNVVQTVGDGNQVAVDQGFWSALWKKLKTFWTWLIG